MRYQRPYCCICFLLLFSSVLSAVPPPLPAPPHASSLLSSSASPSQTTEFKVGLILDMSANVGKICKTVVEMAVADFYAAYPNSTTRLRFLPRSSPRDVVNAAADALDLLVNEEVHAILGPQTSAEAAFIASMGTKARIPIVVFSATSPAVSRLRDPFFVRAAPNDAVQVSAIAAVVQAFGWRRVVPVYEDTDYGTALIPFLVDAMSDVDVQVPYRSAISPNNSDDQIDAELYRLQTLQTRVFVVHVTSPLAPRLFERINKVGMMASGYVWIVTEGLTSLLGTINPPDFVPDLMQGVLGVRPHVDKSQRLIDFNRRWRREFLKEYPNSDITELSNFGLWAYNAVWALAKAAESLGAVGPEFVRNSTGPTEFSKVGFSRTGSNLLEAILGTEFDGLGGRFRLDNGELNVTAYSIVNVNGEKAREIGFWTERYGLTRRLNWNSTSSYSAGRDGLGSVIWPGETTLVPKGWVTPTGGRKLRIALPAGPIEPGFQSFLNLATDPVTKETVASGFVIDVFEAAVEQLPYALPFEYERFRTPNGSSGDYNALVQEVFYQRYDAVVGDVTITANRSMFVDFTLPYTVSGVSMVVPLRDEHSRNAWIFLKPLTLDLWLVSGVFFIFTGAVVWALEHRINDDFRGPPNHQLGTVFYFSFSTLVFAHKEHVMSFLSKVVLIVWVFVVLILQSSYTASLTSMLTVQQLTPTVSDFNELKANGARVGYLKHSFTKGLLLKFGFDESKLVPLRSPQQYQEAMSNGTVAAVVDEIPYLKVFLKDYCNNYTMSDQTYKTGGFGFAFPKGSPLVADLSRAILNITEGDKMSEIERKWFGDQASCPHQGSTLSSSTASLDFKSFWGLFLLTGIASILCSLIYVLPLLYRNRQRLRNSYREGSLGSMVRSIAHIFDQKDVTFHTFRKAQIKEGSTPGTSTAVPSSPLFAESPMSMSNDTFGGGSPLTEHGLGSPSPDGTPTRSPVIAIES